MKPKNEINSGQDMEACKAWENYCEVFESKFNLKPSATSWKSKNADQWRNATKAIIMQAQPVNACIMLKQEGQRKFINQLMGMQSQKDRDNWIASVFGEGYSLQSNKGIWSIEPTPELPEGK